MGKDLVPRFTCPLCGWLAYWSMLEGGPHKLKIRGMKYGGFQEISYHQVWDLGANRDYKRFLQLKVRELAKKLGLKLVDEVDGDAVEEDEIEVDTEQVIEDDLDDLEKVAESVGLSRSSASSAVRVHRSRSVAPAVTGRPGLFDEDWDDEVEDRDDEVRVSEMGMSKDTMAAFFHAMNTLHPHPSNVKVIRHDSSMERSE